MGNHAVGAAFVACAEIAAERRRPGETALAILDMAADRSDVRGADAEFDDATNFGTPFAALIIEAFGEGEQFPASADESTDEDWDRFYDGPYIKFQKRYGLC